MKSTNLFMIGLIFLFFSCSSLPENEKEETRLALELVLADIKSTTSNEHFTLSIGEKDTPTLVMDFYEIPIPCFYSSWPSTSEKGMKEMAQIAFKSLKDVEGIEQFNYFNFRVSLKNSDEILNSGKIPIMDD